MSTERDDIGARIAPGRRIAIGVGVLAPTWQAGAASAHSQSTENSFQAGFLHPLTGPDHLLAMLAVGMISVVLGGAAVWRIPALFLAAMIAGAGVGYLGVRIGAAEPGVAVSVLLLGAALTVTDVTRWRRAAAIAVVLFGLCHGHTHGLELPHAAEPLAFSYGFLIASLFLHVCGLFLATMLSGPGLAVGMRQATGVLMVVAGCGFVATSLFPG